MAVASGDGIFAQLAEVAEIEVVVPSGHRGVSRALRPYRRVIATAAAARVTSDTEWQEAA